MLISYILQVAFSTCSDAINWCISVQMKLINESWDANFLEDAVDDCGLVRGTDRQVLFRGLRVRMGMASGKF